MLLLLAWTVVVVVIPGVTGVIATRLSELPSDTVLSRTVWNARDRAEQENGARYPEFADLLVV